MPTLDVAINAHRAKQGAQQFDSAAKEVKRSAGEVDRSTKKNTKSINSLGATMKKAAVGLIGFAVAYKGVKFFGSAIKESVAFEVELTKVSTMLNEQTLRYLPGYEAALDRLAIRYGQSTGTLSKGLYDILSASVAAGDAIKLLEVATRTAIGGFTSTAIAVDALTTILNAYGLEATEASKIADILSATVLRGKVTFEELATTIGHVVAIAAAAGLSFEQVSASVATMTRSGIDATMAMTALKGIITTFLKPQDEAVKMAEKFGLVLSADTLSTIGLTGALEKLRYATSEETAAIFSNVRALLGAEATRTNVKALIEDWGTIVNAAGLAERNYQKAAESTEQQLKKSKEMWASIKRDLGKGLLPQVRRVLDDLMFLSYGVKEIFADIARNQKIRNERIKLGLSYSKENVEFTEKWMAASKGIVTVNDLYKSFNDTLDRTAKRYKEGFEIAPLPVVDLPELSAAEKKLRAAKRESGAAISLLFKELQKEKELIGLTTEERERSIKVAELEAHAKIILGDKSEELVKMYKAELKELQKAYDLEAFTIKIAEGMGGLIRSPLTALLDETRDIGDVLEDELRNLGTRILESMYEEMITKPLTESLMRAMNPVFDAATNMLSKLLTGVAGGIASGVGNIIGGVFGMAMFGGGGGGGGEAASAFSSPWEKGAVLSAGGIKRFAKGGILTRPTIFPMSNGSVGIAREAGEDEAIMPLGRDAQGRLGVRGNGNGGASIKIINVMDQSAIQEYLNSGDGERAVVNIMRRNASEIQEVVG